MSEAHGGPGWWLASDGRWYPPELRSGAQPPASIPPPGSPYRNGAFVAQKLCPACGTVLIVTSVVCPRCGTPQASPHSKGAAILLAVFLSFWTWVYTYRRDAAKFWIGLAFTIIGVILSVIVVGIFVIFGVWLWSIIDTAVKDEYWYQQYPNNL